MDIKELVGSGSENGKKGYTAQNHTKNHGRWGGNGGSSSGAEAEGYCAYREPRTARKPEGGIQNLEDCKVVLSLSEYNEKRLQRNCSFA